MRALSRLVLVLAVSASGLAPLRVSAQQEDLQREIRESQLRLEEIQNERRLLQEQLAGLRSQVRDATSELRNIERQLSASRSVVAEVDFQVEAISTQVTSTTAELARTRERLATRRRSLNGRLRTIYKRGPLSNVRVLLGAESFADLLNRYRYLHLIASIDRSLVDGVKRLEVALTEQNDELGEQVTELTRLRETKLDEMRELQRVETRRQNALAAFRSRQSEAEDRLVVLEEQESRLSGLVAELEEARVSAAQRDRVAGAPVEDQPNTLSSADVGLLDWPVTGEVIYPFGRQVQPNGTTIRWNGIGIRAQPGTPVEAVRAGTVLLAGPFEGYGPSVVLSHGAGFYTLYLYLQDVGVVEGREVAQGQVIGTVGGQDTPEGPHVEFQVRMLVGGGAPQAVDPMAWLRDPRPR